MPVILDPPQFDTWLKGAPSDALAFLKPYDAAPMRMRPVSRLLNSVKNEGPALLELPQQQALLL